MKIIYCLAGTYNSGGMERIVVNKANWLSLHGYDVIIVTTEQRGRSDYFPLNKNIRRIDLDIFYSDTNSFGILKKGFARQRLMRKHKSALTRVIQSVKPDIVISTFGNEVGFLPSIKDGSLKIAEIHFSRWYRLQLNRIGIWRFIDKYLTYTDYQILKKYDQFICLTQEDRKNWGTLDNISVIPNFIERSNIGFANLDSKSMIAVGRMSYQKGYERLIAAWAIVAKSHPDWYLNIFGSGELKEYLEMKISEEKLADTIKIHSPSPNIMSEYINNSALVMSSRYEGLPMVLLEAMSVGLPLISFDCQCGPRDVIIPDYNGILVEEGNITDLANGIIKIIEDPSLRKKMGQKSLTKSSGFEKDIIMKQWDKLFHSLTKK